LTLVEQTTSYNSPDVTRFLLSSYLAASGSAVPGPALGSTVNCGTKALKFPDNPPLDSDPWACACSTRSLCSLCLTVQPLSITTHDVPPPFSVRLRDISSGVTLRFLTVVTIRRYVLVTPVDYPIDGFSHIGGAFIVFLYRRNVRSRTGRPLPTDMDYLSTELL
jgi:hypothetical protein